MTHIDIATSCADLDAFRNLFSRYIDPEDDALFVATREPADVGTKALIEIRLLDGTLVMRGDGEVVRRWDRDGEGPWARPGHSIRLSGLEGEAAGLYQELIEASRHVSPILRLSVPRVTAPIPQADAPSPAEGEAAAGSAQNQETSTQLILSALSGIADPPSTTPEAQPASESATGSDVDPLWGTLPPPRSGIAWWTGLPDRVRRSRRAQIVVGSIAALIVVGVLALVTTENATAALAPAVQAMTAAPAPVPVAAPVEPAAEPPPATPSGFTETSQRSSEKTTTTRTREGTRKTTTRTTVKSTTTVRRSKSSSRTPQRD